MVGRRGPAQAACTAKELREILGTILCIHTVLQSELDFYLDSYAL